MAPKKTVISEIQVVEDALSVELYKVEQIEERLRTGLLTTETRKKLGNELKEVKCMLYGHEKALKDLRNEKKHAIMLASTLAFAFLLLFGIYSMIFRRL